MENLTYTAAQLAQILQGKVVGNENSQVNRFEKIETATEGALSFLANTKYLPHAYTTKASVLLISQDIALDTTKKLPTLVVVADAYAAFTQLLQLYQKMSYTATYGIEQPSHIHPSAQVPTSEQVYIGAFAYLAEGVKIGTGVQIYPHAYIGKNVQIGDNTIIHSGVKIYQDCQIGDNCIIHAGAVIGSDGFGFAPQQDGTYQKIPQLGKVTLGNNVEVGANTTIDRATLGSTHLANGVKLDNLVQVAHNVAIGEHTVIASQAGISGSTKLGSHVMVGGQVGFSGHISIADGTKIGAQSGIAQSITEPNKAWLGTVASELRQQQRIYLAQRHLPDMVRRLKKLERRMQAIDPNQ